VSNPYTEDELVEQPAIRLFGGIGWQTVSAREEIFGSDGTLGRELSGEVVLVTRLRVALERLNPALPSEAITSAIDELTRDRSAMIPEAANREVYQLLKDGIVVSVPNREEGGQKAERLRVIDWETPANNDFLLVSQFSVTGALYTCRPDLAGFVNGLPLVVIELKKPGVPARAAFDENLTHYKREIPALFWYNALLIASNGADSRVGSLTADWERFFEWKRVEREDEPRRVSLEVMIRGTCDKVRLLDLIENFTLFSEHKAGLVKVIAQNHQYLGVNTAISSMQEAKRRGDGKAGVFWQTQGSGKSFSMVFFAQKILRKLPGNWSFVVVTDRVELDDQIAKTFKAVGAVSEAEGDECHAASGSHLRELLRGNHRYVFTLIHKFQSPEMLCDRPDVIVMTDEAHRSQYDTLAMNMRAALPKALFLAFTGTPLIAGEERTKGIFGDYVSIYDFQQSVEDGATVPLFYENRTPELQLVNPDLNDDIYNLIEEADLDEDQEDRLEQVLSRQYHILTRDDRLDKVAQDIVRHFLGRGFVGKAMVVSIDKATALRMYTKVRKIWDAELASVQQELSGSGMKPERKEELTKRLDVLKTTDMAVIVSPGQNEIAQMRALGLDIEPHRRRMHDSEPGLDEKFKDTSDPLRLVFVCAMWLTGFDAPSCSTLYLDKPMRNHTLMQTIARANRVFPGKYSGLIVDYANVFASLEKALAIYGVGKDGGRPVEDKTKLVEELRVAVAEATAFCSKQGVDLASMEALPSGGMERLGAMETTVNALVAPDPVQRDFLAHERLVRTLFGAVKPDPAGFQFGGRVATLGAIADAIKAKTHPDPVDISKILGEITQILDQSVSGVSIPSTPGTILDLSKIDFEALAKRFKASKSKKADLEVLKAAIRAQLARMIEVNSTRADFREQFEEMIEEYNNGSRNIEDLFNSLVKLTQSLSVEQQRHVREGMTEDELVIFDILLKPAPEITADEKEQIKKAVRELLARLKQLLVLDWRRRSASRSQIKLAIEDELDKGLPRAFGPEIYKEKCSALFEHVYERYPQAGEG
jgi:type I restriction enzyme R subunit